MLRANAMSVGEIIRRGPICVDRDTTTLAASNLMRIYGVK